MRGSEQRVQANSEAIKFTRNLKAVTEKKVAMENRNRSRMQVRVKPDQNLAAALESVRKGVTAKGQGGSLKERAKQASGAGPRARTPNASARSPFSGRVRTSGTADDRPRPAWRGSSATGAAADVRERQTSKLMVVRSRTPTRQSTAPGEAGDPAEGQPALAGEEADMEERSKDVERRRAREAGLSSKETQLERRETALRKASETLEREKAAIAVRLTVFVFFLLFFILFLSRIFSGSLVWRHWCGVVTGGENGAGAGAQGARPEAERGGEAAEAGAGREGGDTPHEGGAGQPALRR